jgi:hypothetical protein
MQKVYSSILQVLSTAEECAERGYVLPALILLHSTIDSMGWMIAPDPKAAVRARFMRWADSYLLPVAPALKCTSLELYAARCGILHTFTPDSDLSEKGTRRVGYAWGNASLQTVEGVSDAAGSDRWVALHLSHLIEAVRLGTAQMFEDSQTDAILAARLEERGARFFESIEQSGLDAFKDPDPPG